MLVNLILLFLAGFGDAVCRLAVMHWSMLRELKEDPVFITINTAITMALLALTFLLDYHFESIGMQYLHIYPLIGFACGFFEHLSWIGKIYRRIYRRLGSSD